MLNIKITKDIIHDFFYNKLSKIDKIAVLVIIFFSIMIFFCGYLFHPIPNQYLSEGDGYIYYADSIRNGELPKDQYGPLFYSILTAIFGAIFNNSFIGGKFVSQMSSIILIIFVYLIAKKLFDQKIAILSIIFLSINYCYNIYSVLASTDMLFATLSCITIFFLILLVERFSIKRLILLSLFFSLSYFTRYTAISLIPVIITGIIFSSSKSLKLIIINISLFCGLSIFFLLPHFIITTYNFNNPFYNENWKNLAFKLYSPGNWNAIFLEETSYNGFCSVISKSPKIFFISGIKELFIFLKECGETSKIFMFSWHLFTILFIIGIIILLIEIFRKPLFKTSSSKSNFLILLFICFHTILISFTFFALDRFILTILLFVYIIIFYCFFYLVKKIKIFKKFEVIQVYVMILCLILQCNLLYNKITEYYNNLPIAEFKAAKELQEIYGKNINVFHTSDFINRYVDYNCIRLSTYNYGYDFDIFFQELKNQILENKIDFIIFGRRYDFILNELLRNNESIPYYLDALKLSNNYAVFKVNNLN